MMDREYPDIKKYRDIIEAPHHVSETRPRMSLFDRAAQFAPFAALTGYGDVIEEVSRLTDSMPELAEDKKEVLDRKMKSFTAGSEGPRELIITFFVPDGKKEGGSYCRISGRVKRSDDGNGNIVLDDGTLIRKEFVVDIDKQL